MPGRIIPLITDQIYHIVNRGIASQPVFLDKRDYERALETIFYYQNRKVSTRYSFFLRLSSSQRAELLGKLKKERKFLVEIIAYCLIPNHLHLLLKQIQDNGISVFMGKMANSYTRYFNTRHKRTGHLFQGKFKAVRVETEEQLLHLSRYIHLNPYSSYLIKNIKDLVNYPYSSLNEYLLPEKEGYCQKAIILDNVGEISSYQKFLFDQADYQRRLEEIKHLAIEV